MRTLFTFLVKNVHWLLFFLLVGASTGLIIKNNDFQKSKYAAIEGEVVGSLYSVSGSISSYFGLKKTNEYLLERTANLESRIQYLEGQILQMKDSAVAQQIIHRIDFDSVLNYRCIMARVVNNSLLGDNYITLNKGTGAGVARNMGVFSATGVVGFVMNASHNYSLVLPVLNPNFHLSCKIKGSNYFGSLSWDGKNIAYASLHELPSYTQFKNGDTIVTSGHSFSFPEGIPVGIVEELKQRNDNFNVLKIKLLTDFGALNEVLLVDKKNRKEQQELENAAKAKLGKGAQF